MDTEELANVLQAEKTRIDQLDINDAVFNIYQRLHAEDFNVKELVARHMYDFIGDFSRNDRIYNLSTLYIVLRENGYEKERCAKLITYLNGNDLFEAFKLEFAEDVLEKMAESHVAFYPFDETANWDHCEHEVIRIVELLHDFLGTVLFSYRNVIVNNCSKETAQSNIDREYRKIAEFARQNCCEDILPKLDDIRKHYLD